MVVVDKNNIDLQRLIEKVTKNTNANYKSVVQGTYAPRGSDEWLMSKMVKKISQENYVDWLNVMLHGKYNQKKKARQYAKLLLGIE